MTINKYLNKYITRTILFFLPRPTSSSPRNLVDFLSSISFYEPLD